MYITEHTHPFVLFFFFNGASGKEPVLQAIHVVLRHFTCARIVERWLVSWFLYLCLMHVLT